MFKRTLFAGVLLASMLLVSASGLGQVSVAHSQMQPPPITGAGSGDAPQQIVPAGINLSTGQSGADACQVTLPDDLTQLYIAPCADCATASLAALGWNLLQGGAGSDMLQGGAGSDMLTGGPGVDMIFAPVNLTGGAGSDMLQGGAGSDMLTGGPGEDWRDWGMIPFSGREIVANYIAPDSGQAWYMLSSGVWLQASQAVLEDGCSNTGQTLSRDDLLEAGYPLAGEAATPGGLCQIELARNTNLFPAPCQDCNGDVQVNDVDVTEIMHETRQQMTHVISHTQQEMVESTAEPIIGSYTTASGQQWLLTGRNLWLPAEEAALLASDCNPGLRFNEADLALMGYDVAANTLNVCQGMVTDVSTIDNGPCEGCLSNLPRVNAINAEEPDAPALSVYNREAFEDPLVASEAFEDPLVASEVFEDPLVASEAFEDPIVATYHDREGVRWLWLPAGVWVPAEYFELGDQPCYRGTLLAEVQIRSLYVYPGEASPPDTPPGDDPVDTTSGEVCSLTTLEDRTLIRVGPGENRGVFWRAGAGAVFTGVGHYDDADDQRWWQIDEQDVPGGENAQSLWVSDEEVEASEACDDLPGVDPSPVIIPAPTAVPATPTPPPADNGGGPSDGGDPPPTVQCFDVSIDKYEAGGATGTIGMSGNDPCPNGSGFVAGSSVTIQAQENLAGTFTGWTGSCPGLPTSNAVHVFTINGSCSATANFVLN